MRSCAKVLPWKSKSLVILQKSERKLDCKALSKQRTSSCSLSLLWRRESWPIQWRSSDTKPKRSIEALSTSSTRKGCLKWKRNDHQIPIKYAYKWAINSNKLVSEGRTIVNNISLLETSCSWVSSLIWAKNNICDIRLEYSLSGRKWEYSINRVPSLLCRIASQIPPPPPSLGSVVFKNFKTKSTSLA